jgi:peptidoglycan/LPS O-acetylase OafA/YrhL
MTDKIKYFLNLNGLRFIAASTVVIHHVEQTKDLYGFKNYFGNATVQLIGSMGVTLFFVLSGFLITYLLLQEKAVHQTVQLGKFYMRRVLRIWPLYYLVVLLGLFVFPHLPFFQVPETGRSMYLPVLM